MIWHRKKQFTGIPKYKETDSKVVYEVLSFVGNPVQMYFETLNGPLSTIL